MVTAKKHSSSAFKDKTSVSLVENILSKHGAVMPNINSHDTWPDIDGSIDINDKSGNIVSVINVQVKTFSSNDHNYKYNCPTSLLAYCRDTAPCMLLVVDSINNKVYWLYIDRNKAIKLLGDKKTKTRTIQLNKNKYFSESNVLYIDEWIGIAKTNQYRYQTRDELENRYRILLERSNPAIGKVQDSYKKIHEFLDCYNYEMRTYFSIINNRYFKDAWKIGIALLDETESSLGYILYPISNDKNDIQVKEVNFKNYDKYKEGGYGAHVYPATNPLRKNPINFSREIIKSQLNGLIKKKNFNNMVDLYIAREYIFAFVDKFRIQMGLSEKDVYATNEIEKAFYIYLPLWLQESHRIMFEKDRNNFKERLSKGFIRYFDPEVISELHEEEITEISNIVNATKRKLTPNFYMGNDRFPFETVVEFIGYLKNAKVKKINRLYKKPDYSRFKKYGGWKYNAFSKKDTESNLKMLFNNIENVYSNFIKINFPKLVSEFKLFNDAKLITLSYDLRNFYEFGEFPKNELTFFKSAKNNKFQIRILADKEKKEFEGMLFKKKRINYKGLYYFPYSLQTNLIDYIYKETPMLDFIYDEIKRKIDKYFY